MKHPEYDNGNAASSNKSTYCVARDVESLAFGLIFALLTSVALTALFESIRVLEDPFVANTTLDGIDINEELD
eukprot:15127809-Ditylum_brightwellii.AAC.1